MADELLVESVDAAATDTLGSEISELLDLPPLEGGETVEPTPTEEPSSEAPTGDGVNEGEVGDVVEGVDTTPTTESQVAEVPSEIESLKAQIEALKGVVTQLSTPKEGDRKSPELAPNLDDLIANVDFDEIMESRDKFMGFIKDALQIVAQSTTGYVQSVVPEVVTRQVSMAEVRETFYKENADLNAVRPYVAMVASNVAQANPEWGVAEVLAEAAKVARESLGISKITPTETRPTQKAPVLPGARGVRQQPQQKSDLQKQIDDLLED